jgi:hypothetical protein
MLFAYLDSATRQTMILEKSMNKTKLVLNQETLRKLTQNELENVVGGVLTQVRTCQSTFCCPTFTCVVTPVPGEPGE